MILSLSLILFFCSFFFVSIDYDLVYGFDNGSVVIYFNINDADDHLTNPDWTGGTPLELQNANTDLLNPRPSLWDYNGDGILDVIVASDGGVKIYASDQTNLWVEVDSREQGTLSRFDEVDLINWVDVDDDGQMDAVYTSKITNSNQFSAFSNEGVIGVPAFVSQSASRWNPMAVLAEEQVCTIIV
jgi:hypothetical protein